MMFRKTKRISAFILTMVTMLCISQPSFAVNFTKEDGYTVTTGDIEGVKITTRAENDSYKSGDKIKFIITIQNDSGKDIGDIALNYTLTCDNGEAELINKTAKVASIKAGESKDIYVITGEIDADDGVNIVLIVSIIAGIVVVALVILFFIFRNKKKKKKLVKPIITEKVISIILVTLLVSGMLTGTCNNVYGEEVKNSDFNKVSVHDPSIVKDPETNKYYLFGSHRAFAESTDLKTWKTINNNVSSDYKNLFNDVWNCFSKTDKNNDITGNMWAPDVIYNKTMKKWCMYMSVNGDDHHSAIALLTADAINGPYVYVDEVVFSGVSGSTSGSSEFITVTASKKVDVGDSSFTLNAKIKISEKKATTRFAFSDYSKVLGITKETEIPSRYIDTNVSMVNAIDPCVTYDKDGNIWMTYGSWSAGIYQLKLDNSTGLRDYNYKYETVSNKSDEYLGYKLAGGYYNSGEGTYILGAGNYYYLFISYGNLENTGGYNMRVYRSESINGPYVDMNGVSSILTSWDPQIGFNDKANSSSKYNTRKGLKIFGTYDMYGISDIQVAQGHNSALLDSDGKIYLVYHSRYKDKGEAHSVRVHQMFINEDGWLVAAPYEYSGETLSTGGYATTDICGTYEFLIHDPSVVYALNSTTGIVKPVSITLGSDGKITGDKTGSYTVTNGSNVTMTINDVVYKGVFIKQANELESRDQTMTFTLAGNNVTAWGVKNPSNN